MLVFRDSAGKHRLRPADVLAGLFSFSVSDRLDAPTRAGELESALTDCGHPAASVSAALTDAVAQGNQKIVSERLAELRTMPLPDELIVNTPEGFAYYALDPFAFAEGVRVLAHGEPIAVIGIRSAGVPLSALCAARGGMRMTVRPHGHPYDRELALNDAQSRWIRDAHAAGKMFFVVDEGPGLSGSSFLCVAEALVGLGVPPERVHLIGSRHAEPQKLVARDAARRWARFAFHRVSRSLVVDDATPLVAGAWRNALAEDSPGVWGQLTPPSFVSQNGTVRWKFEGLGTAGALAAERARLLSDRNQSFPWVDRAYGYNAYRIVGGRVARRADLDEAMIRRMAEYCAFRQANFACARVDPDELRRMAIHNVKQLQGVQIELQLETIHPVICDGKMMPYEWFITADNILKADAVSHGDSHFFPGPCDIAWDLAGALVEWQMDAAQADAFISAYEKASGDHVADRLDDHCIAYCAFRAAYARMAMSSIPDDAERTRFARDAQRYDRELRRRLRQWSARRTLSRSA